MPKIPGKEPINNSSENSDYGSTVTTSDSSPIASDEKTDSGVKSSGDGISGRDKNEKGSTPTAATTKGRTGGDTTSRPKEIENLKVGVDSTGEKPHSLNFLARYTPGRGSKDGGMEEVDDLETLQLVDRGNERELTNTEAILHLFKIFTGPSTIGMPTVMKSGGLLFGTIGFLVFGYLTAYGNILIVNCGRLLCHRTKVSSLRYEELMELIVLSYSDTNRVRKAATIVRRVTSIMLCLCQFGILAFYIQVIGTIVQSFLEESDLGYNLPLYVTKVFISLALVPYSWMKNLKILSWFSLIANFSILICVVTILQYACRNLRPLSEMPLITEDLWTIPLFISASVFTVEGVPMLLPIENRVKNPEAFGGLCGVITLAASGNIVINMCLGFYGYLSFGDSVPGNVLVALPNFWWYNVISLLYGLMVFLTFTLQVFLPAEFIVDALHKRTENEWFRKYGDILVRTLLVMASYLVTTVVSDIGLIMSLTGAFCSVPLLFLFPSIGELVLLKREPKGIPFHVYVRDVTIFTFGVLTFVVGTVVAVDGVIKRF